MSKQDLEKFSRTFIISQLDNCNGVFTGLSKKKATSSYSARVLTQTDKVKYITTVLYVKGLILKYCLQSTEV